MKPVTLDPTDWEILSFIRNEVTKKGYPPTYREICSKININSTSAVYERVQKLISFGYLRNSPTKPRTLELVGERENFHSGVKVPIVQISFEGDRVLEAVEDYFNIPAERLPSPHVFAVQVPADNAQAGVFRGDFVLVERSSASQVPLTADAGIAAFWNCADRAVFVCPKDVATKNLIPLGRVVGVMRFFFHGSV